MEIKWQHFVDVETRSDLPREGFAPASKNRPIFVIVWRRRCGHSALSRWAQAETS